jgi:hypothetical protein
MLNKQEIEKYAKDITDIAGWDREVYISGFIDGSTFVNELQPYTAEDMKKFAEDCNKRGCFYSHNDKLWWYRYSDDKQTSDELLKLWEESK